MRPKSLALITALSILYGGVACKDNSVSKTPTVATATIALQTPTTEVTPQLQLYPELLAPKPIRGGAQLLPYSSGGVINSTRGIELFANVTRLNQVATDPRYGIKFQPGEQSVTYLFPESFKRGRGMVDAMQLVQEETPLVLQNFAGRGVTSGRVSYSIISVADIFDKVARENPSVPVGSEAFRKLASTQLTLVYIALSELRIYDIVLTPSNVPEIDARRSALISQGSLPLAFLRINPNYYDALGLSPTH